MVKAVVGANWGDEGKGKITDMLAEKSDYVVRFQGGANAGHTIINDYGKFALHILPSGIFNSHSINVLGNGVALNIRTFHNELDEIKKHGVPDPKIIISDRAQVIMPYHILFDEYEEERLGGKAFGSTKSGIAPFYSDKYAKIGFQVNELFDDKLLKSRLDNVCTIKNTLLEHLYHKPLLNPEELYENLLEERELIKDYIGDTSAVLQEALLNNRQILLEGQLGTLKDADFGIYPFVTSSNTIAGYGCVGAGVPPTSIDSIIAVTKAYSSAVGGGAFVSELFGEEAETMRRLGGDKGEYGATTGRPRRVGWFDAVATKYGCRIQGATEAVLTAVDVLGYLDEIKLCVGYEIGGKITSEFPVTTKLNGAKPVYKTMPGWKCDIRGASEYNSLPKELKDYVDYIEQLIGIPIKMVSTGPKREDIAYRIL